MAEAETKRVGKFTVIEEAPSETGESRFAEAASQESGPSSAENSVDAFTLKTSQTRRRGRPPGAKSKPVIQAVSEAPADYRLWAQLLIGSTNTVVVTWLGQDCAMERREAEMLEPPIARILARLPTSGAQKVAAFIDPMVILIAMGTWANRIIRVQRAKRPAGISAEELNRASGITDLPSNVVNGPTPLYQQPVEPDLPQRTKVQINPNGIPVAITEQMGEL